MQQAPAAGWNRWRVPNGPPQLLSRTRGRIVHKALDRISPLAVPVMLEIGREPVPGEASDVLLAEAAEDLIREAMG